MLTRHYTHDSLALANPNEQTIHYLCYREKSVLRNKDVVRWQRVLLV